MRDSAFVLEVHLFISERVHVGVGLGVLVCEGCVCLQSSVSHDTTIYIFVLPLKGILFQFHQLRFPSNMATCTYSANNSPKFCQKSCQRISDNEKVLFGCFEVFGTIICSSIARSVNFQKCQKVEFVLQNGPKWVI